MFTILPLTAMLEPDPVNGGLLGPTAQCIIADQFNRSRSGDRFWYENAPDPEKNTDNTAFTRCQLRELRRVSVSKLICDNMDFIPAVPRFGFIQSKTLVDCDKLPEMDLRVFTTRRCNIPARRYDKYSSFNIIQNWDQIDQSGKRSISHY